MLSFQIEKTQNLFLALRKPNFLDIVILSSNILIRPVFEFQWSKRGGLRSDCQEAVVTYLLFLMFIDKTKRFPTSTNSRCFYNKYNVGMKKTTPPFCLKYIESDVNIILKFKDTFLILKNDKSIGKFLWLQ